MEKTSQETLFQRATMYYNQRQFETSLQLLGQCLEQGPSTMGYNNRAIANYRLGHMEDAFRDLHKSIELDHLNFIAHFNLFSLNALQQAAEEALSSLALAVSSIHTVTCRQSPSERHADRALQLSYNNKEAMMMRGLLYLQRSQYLKSLKMIKSALEWQTSLQNHKNMLTLLASLSKLAGEEVSEPLIKNVGGQKYQLKTNITSKYQDKESELITSLLLEFNQLYWNLVGDEDEEKSEKTKSKIFSQHHSSFINSASIKQRGDCQLHQQKEDEDGNKVTTHNSIMRTDEPQSSIAQSSTLGVEHPECLQIDPSTQNSIIPEQPSTISEAILALQEQKKEKSTSINFVLYYAQIDPQLKNLHLYTVLEYDSQHNDVFRSSLSQPDRDYYLWNQMSSPFVLTANPSVLTLKLYRKEYSCFRDELIGQSTLQINQLGMASLPLVDRRNRQTGTILIGVTLSQ